MTKADKFMQFWKIVNEALKARGQPEMLYGEAKGYWNDYLGWAA